MCRNIKPLFNFDPPANFSSLTTTAEPKDREVETAKAISGNIFTAPPYGVQAYFS